MLCFPIIKKFQFYIDFFLKWPIKRLNLVFFSVHVHRGSQVLVKNRLGLDPIGFGPGLGSGPGLGHSGSGRAQVGPGLKKT